MPDSDDDTEHMCPVCRKHTPEDSLASQQVILRGMQAILEQDDQLIEDIYSVLTSYDAHVCISLCLLMMGNLADMIGLPVKTMIEHFRDNLSASQTKATE